jgi:TPP-dependent pyruvate/acetoin dehydrogenase alpha subunit
MNPIKMEDHLRDACNKAQTRLRQKKWIKKKRIEKLQKKMEAEITAAQMGASESIHDSTKKPLPTTPDPFSPLDMGLMTSNLSQETSRLLGLLQMGLNRPDSGQQSS